MRLRSLILLLPALALVACNNSGPKNDKRSATGEVLQGTTTDAMIPLGQLTSQPPLLPPKGNGPTTPEQAADQDNGAGASDTDGKTPNDGATATPTAPPSAAASAAP
jgi:hypothetical protein